MKTTRTILGFCFLDYIVGTIDLTARYYLYKDQRISVKISL